MKKKMIAGLLAACMLLSMTACGNDDGKVTLSEFDNMTDSQQEEYLENQLERMDEEAEQENAAENYAPIVNTQTGDEGNTAEPEVSEEPEVTDYTLPNLDLTDIDPEKYGAFNIIGLDFSNFPQLNGDYTIQWNWKSYDDTPITSDVTGLDHDPLPSYTLTFKADSDFYSNFTDEVISWFESQPALIAKNTLANDQSYHYGYAYNWLDETHAIVMDIGDKSVSFTLHEYAERHFEGVITSVTGSDTSVSWLTMTSSTTIDDLTAGSSDEIGFFGLTILDDSNTFDSGARPMNDADLSRYISVDPALQEGDRVSVDIVSGYLKPAYYTCADDFLSIRITKIG